MNIAIGKIKQFLCVAGDIAMFYLALFLTLAIRYGAVWERHWQVHFLPFTIISISSLIVFYVIGLYDLSLARNNLFFFITLTQALLFSIILAVLFFYFIPYFGITPKTNLFISFLIFSLLFVLWRQFYNRFIKSQALLNNVLILGQDQETKELVQYVKSNPQLGYYIKKVLPPEDVRLLHNLIDIIMKEKIQTAVIDVDPHKDKNLIQNLYQCLPLKIMVADLPAFYEKITGKIPVSSIGEIWFLQNLMNDQKTFFKGIKRIIDIIFAILISVPSLVLTPLIIFLIKIDSKGPIFYRQKRVGQDSRIFEIIKFRTMVQDAEKQDAQWAKDNNKRITRVGRFLRKIRLDELPQIWNVLKGEMSFVGPRPERPEFAFSEDLLEQIPFYQVRQSIKPGLTGWAQIKYPHSATIKDTMQKLQYDLFYIKNRSIPLELAIILKTIKIILSGGGR